jgi:hypothetical protein
MEHSAYTKTLYEPTTALYRDVCQAWDLDDPAYADEYACHWVASSVDQLNNVWELLNSDVSSCLLPEQYECAVNRANGRHYCFTERIPGVPFLQWAQRAGSASGEVVLYNHLTVGLQPRGESDASPPSAGKGQESVLRQQRYHALVADIARRLAAKEEWQSGRIGEGDEYGVAVPASRLPRPVFVFVRLVEADDTVEYTVYNPELSYVRLSLAGIPVSPSFLNETRLDAAGRELQRVFARERGHLQHWALRPDPESEALAVSATAPIPALDGARSWRTSPGSPAGSSATPSLS